MDYLEKHVFFFSVFSNLRLSQNCLVSTGLDGESDHHRCSQTLHGQTRPPWCSRTARASRWSKTQFDSLNPWIWKKPILVFFLGFFGEEENEKQIARWVFCFDLIWVVKFASDFFIAHAVGWPFCRAGWSAY